VVVQGMALSAHARKSLQLSVATAALWHPLASAAARATEPAGPRLPRVRRLSVAVSRMLACKGAAAIEIAW
jgi:hypothetical protein